MSISEPQRYVRTKRRAPIARVIGRRRGFAFAWRGTFIALAHAATGARAAAG